MTFTVLVPVSMDNGESAVLQLFWCKTGYSLWWEEFLFGMAATTCTDSENTALQNKTEYIKLRNNNAHFSPLQRQRIMKI